MARKRYKRSLFSRILGFGYDSWYKFKCWAWHRYTTVKPTTLPGHGWVDRDELMLHCMFQCLVDFVEKEERPDPCESLHVYKEKWGDLDVTDTYLNERRNTEIEILALYDWWKFEYPKIENCLLNEPYEEINQMCHRLIDIRENLWT